MSDELSRILKNSGLAPLNEGWKSVYKFRKFSLEENVGDGFYIVSEDNPKSFVWLSSNLDEAKTKFMNFTEIFTELSKNGKL